MNKKENNKFFIELMKVLTPLIIAFIGDNGLSILNFTSRSKKIFFVVIGIWFLVAIFRFIIKKIVSYRDSKQVEEFAFVYWNVDFDTKESIFRKVNGFFWLIYLEKPLIRNPFPVYDIEQKDHNIIGLFGPYCPKDKCEMNLEKTYLARYKYICPYCKLTKKNKKDSDTLRRDIEKIVRLKLNQEDLLN